MIDCLKQKWQILTSYKQLSAILLCSGVFASFGNAAQAITADDVLNKMNADQRFGYISGVIEGLAFARWAKDQPDSTGMNCIYDWYYQGGEERSNQVDTWLRKNLDKPVGALLYVLIKKNCGE